jgi:hypothetical protein
MVAASDSKGPANGNGVPQPTTLSTLPGPNHNWSVTLSEKVIASNFVSSPKPEDTE